MLPAIREYFESRDPEFRTKRYLIAVSGGRDSMALLHAMHQLGLLIASAHVHFGLRPEADFEQDLVQSFSGQLSIECFTTVFDTKQYATFHKISTQEAARQLRYEWFAALKERHGFDHIVTAHHQEDLMETWLINAIRGSGWRGMMSIPEENNLILRPLLKVSRKEIDHYISLDNIPFMEDSSNSGDDYLRNRIRHHLLPVLDNISRGRAAQLPATINHLKDAGALLQSFLDELHTNMVIAKADFLQLHVAQLLRFPNPAYVLGELLYRYGFSFHQAENLWNAFEKNHSGAVISGNDYEALVDRVHILLRKITVTSNETLNIDRPDLPFRSKTNSGEIEIIQSIAPEHFTKNNFNIYFNENKISWPIRYSRWHPGDRIQSFGLEGKYHHVQDILTDAKYNKWEKESVYVVRDQEGIIWIPGLRMAERGRVSPGDVCIQMMWRSTAS